MVSKQLHTNPISFAAYPSNSNGERPASGAEPTLAQLLAMQNRLFERMVASNESIGVAMT
ncbi:hypothetical protein E2562_003809 [Oryza meyeriana var. granulata]|uniref:Uncharacterized protein n=1 Tax=Oryza meyeriana var. granulata TaxID=110450 RepID=A0A6G1BT50_9ORYZ|nr:hypothetical protein E2562_003809 [Oryza meyeriana var. granulata]